MPEVAQMVSRYEPRLREIETKIEKAKDAEERLNLFGQQRMLNEEVSKEIFPRRDVKNALRAKFEKCLADAGMSPAGRKTVTNFVLTEHIEALTR